MALFSTPEPQIPGPPPAAPWRDRSYFVAPPLQVAAAVTARGSVNLPERVQEPRWIDHSYSAAPLGPRAQVGSFFNAWEPSYPQLRIVPWNPDRSFVAAPTGPQAQLAPFFDAFEAVYPPARLLPWNPERSFSVLPVGPPAQVGSFYLAWIPAYPDRLPVPDRTNRTTSERPPTQPAAPAPPNSWDPVLPGRFPWPAAFDRPARFGPELVIAGAAAPLLSWDPALPQARLTPPWRDYSARALTNGPAGQIVVVPTAPLAQVGPERFPFPPFFDRSASGLVVVPLAAIPIPAVTAPERLPPVAWADRTFLTYPAAPQAQVGPFGLSWQPILPEALPTPLRPFYDRSQGVLPPLQPAAPPRPEATLPARFPHPPWLDRGIVAAPALVPVVVVPAWFGQQGAPQRRLVPVWLDVWGHVSLPPFPIQAPPPVPLGNKHMPVSRYTPSTVLYLGQGSAALRQIRQLCRTTSNQGRGDYLYGHEYVGNPGGIGSPRAGYKRYFNENDFQDVAAALNLAVPPTGLYTAIVGGLVNAILVEPGPVIYLQLPDLSAATVSALVAAIRAATP